MSNFKARVGFASHRLKFGVKKHSPEILIVLGTVSIIGGTVAACRATLKAQDILKKKNEELEAARKVKEMADEGTLPDGEEYSDESYKKDLMGSYTRFAVEIAKVYAPAFILTTLGIVSVFASNHILRKRCASLSAAYMTLDTMFKNYRKNVVERYGAEVDEELRYGVKREKIEVEEVDPETGKTKKVKKDVKVIDINGEKIKVSDYARLFDDMCGAYSKDAYGHPDTYYNLMILKAIENEMNVKLRGQGYLFLNDVYHALGIEQSIAGQQVGWIYDHKKPEDEQVGDGFVSFGVKQYNQRVFDGYEDVILLDFNVDGPILERLEKVLPAI